VENLHTTGNTAGTGNGETMDSNRVRKAYPGNRQDFAQGILRQFSTLTAALSAEVSIPLSRFHYAG
jgi:hypothetical protein